MNELGGRTLEPFSDEADKALRYLLDSWFARVQRETLGDVDRQDLLWHYTRRKAFDGIVQDRMVTIWATHLAFLNDESEPTYVRDLIHRVRPNAEIDLSGVITAPREHPIMGLYLRDQFGFSLSGTRNDPSQWRTYAPHPDGIAIGFRPKMLFAPPAGEGSLVRCSYDQEAQLADILWGVELLEGSQLPRELMPMLLGILVRTWSPWLKPASYQSENEWRWVPASAKKILERPSSRGRAPYVECSVNTRAVAGVIVNGGARAVEKTRRLLPPPEFDVSSERVTSCVSAVSATVGTDSTALRIGGSC